MPVVQHHRLQAVPCMFSLRSFIMGSTAVLDSAQLLYSPSFSTKRASTCMLLLGGDRVVVNQYLYRSSITVSRRLKIRYKMWIFGWRVQLPTAGFNKRISWLALLKPNSLLDQREDNLESPSRSTWGTLPYSFINDGSSSRKKTPGPLMLRRKRTGGSYQWKNV